MLGTSLVVFALNVLYESVDAIYCITILLHDVGWVCVSKFSTPPLVTAILSILATYNTVFGDAGIHLTKSDTWQNIFAYC